MSVLRYFSGSDTFGRFVERALRSDGQWFERYQFQGSFGLQTSRWQECEKPEFETHYTNAYNGELEKYTKPQMYWGFNKMYESEDVPRIRLPKAA